jgi:hypothetical protein
MADPLDNLCGLSLEYEGLLEVDERLVNGLVQATRSVAQLPSE